MTGWDFLDKIIGLFPPIAAGLFLVAAGLLFLIGFSKYGMNFLKYGFKQSALDESLKKRFNDMDAKQSALDQAFERRFDAFERRFDVLDQRIDGLRTEFRTELDTIKVNHFGHLKNYLGVLNGILLDKNVISNQDKARLDNELRGM